MKSIITTFAFVFIAILGFGQITESSEGMKENLDQYLGTYESYALPMDMTFSKEGNTLIMSATGQSSSALKSEGNHSFSIEKYGVHITFVPDENKMNFKQHGMAFTFTRKE